MNMAFTAPARFAGLTVTPSAHARFRRQFTPFATLSTPPTTSSSSRETVDWVKATASFFEGDNRPIMLFDGMVTCSMVYTPIFPIPLIFYITFLFSVQLGIDVIYYKLW